jgi:Secretion system C-terminal sorting domain
MKVLTNTSKSRVLLVALGMLFLTAVYFSMPAAPKKSLRPDEPAAQIAPSGSNETPTVIAPTNATPTTQSSTPTKHLAAKLVKKHVERIVDADYENEVAEANEAAKERAEKESVEARWKWEFEMTKNPATGKIPKGIQNKAIESAKSVAEFQLPATLETDGTNSRTLPTIGITVRGPNNYGGRTRAIGFDVRNPLVILAGGVSSGIFRSTNGGATWARVTPAGEIHSVTTFAQDTRTGQQDTWYCGTGENLGNSASGTGAQYLGNGVLKSTDNGLTWTPLASTRGNLYAFDNDFDYINRIIVNPNTGDLLVAASELVKRSTDGGATWTDALGNTNTSTGRPTDLIYNAVGNMFYAAIHGGDALGGVYSSTNGIAWTPIRTPAQLAAGGVGRITLSNVANTANIVAFYEMTTPVTCTSNNAVTSNAGLQLFNATASTWTDHTQKIGDCAAGTSNPKVINFQGGYNMCIATKPNDPDFVYLGGTEIYRLQLSTGDYQYIGGDQGAANATNLHVDNHILLFEPNSNVKMWAGNDGGMRFTDVTGTIAAGPTGGYTWTDRNTGYITYQYYRADISPANGSDFMAGAAQDNAITLQPSTAAAQEIHGGDGTCIGVISGSSLTTYNVLVATQNGSTARIENGTTNNVQPTGFAQGFKTLFLLDADNTNYLYYPTNAKKLLRTRIASTIAATTVSGDAATGWEEITGVAATLTGDISAFCVSRNAAFSNATYSASNANRRMYLGTEDGKVYSLADPAFTAVTTTPTLITPAGATGFVSDIAVSSINDKEVLVTYSNYGVPSVWYTADASVATPTWVNVEGPSGSAVELASARSAMIVRTGGSNLYIVGTSTGLYGTMTLSGATTVWERIGAAEIALSPSVSMRLRTSDNKMSLGTHGNGLFMLSFPAAVLPLDLLSFTGAKKNNSVQLTWTAANERNFSHYNVQKSLDGKNFTFLSQIKAIGGGQYQSIDEQPTAGLNYYRLEMMDLDGKKRLSNVISVSMDASEKPLRIYPNPTNDFVMVDNQSANTTVTVVNTLGQMVAQYPVQAQGQTRIDLTNLPRGTYFVQSGKESVQVVKQ